MFLIRIKNDCSQAFHLKKGKREGEPRVLYSKSEIRLRIISILVDANHNSVFQTRLILVDISTL